MAVTKAETLQGEIAAIVEHLFMADNQLDALDNVAARLTRLVRHEIAYFSEWLDSEGFVIPTEHGIELSHEELAREYLELP